MPNKILRHFRAFRNMKILISTEQRNLEFLKKVAKKLSRGQFFPFCKH